APPAAAEPGAPPPPHPAEPPPPTRRTVPPPPRRGAADLTSADVADEQAVAVVVPSAASAAPEAGATRSPTADAGTSTRSTAATAPATASGDWMIQLGSFGEAANAERLASRISTFGYRPTISAYRSGDRMLHRVRIGGFESRNTAEAAVASLSAHGFVAQVVSPE
ncbi:MAG: SPOR domain-containing protein, partial [Gammaproteobacteria bacterium]|nr:SPOR domain-containing protein [Gammaproteobacteria bacterium]